MKPRTLQNAGGKTGLRSLEQYKQIVGAKGPLSFTDMDEDFDEAAFANVLVERLENIPGGSPDADNYHRLAVGICTFLFYPNLIKPIREFRQHQGRKRVDIKYSNAAEDGFFHQMNVANQTRALAIMFECKNYTQPIGNQELDQLSVRFGHLRGFLGFLLCRNMEDRERVIEGCRDAINDGRGYMIALDDTDICHLLRLAAEGRRDLIDAYLRQRFDEISN